MAETSFFTSWLELPRPKLILNVEMFCASDMPMDANTGDGSTEPDPQADPLDTAKPSRSNFANKISLRCP